MESARLAVEVQEKHPNSRCIAPSIEACRKSLAVLVSENMTSLIETSVSKTEIGNPNLASGDFCQIERTATIPGDWGEDGESWLENGALRASIFRGSDYVVGRRTGVGGPSEFMAPKPRLEP